ncbi:MAG: YceH family protein [Aeromonas sp.]
MELVLGPLEARVIGCLIEKEICTPDQYPLSLNALINACNQKSNREPVLELTELEIRATVDELIRKRLVVNTADFNARVPRYQHRFCNTEFGELTFSAQALGIVCELLLRGPQTPGELRSRTQRLCQFDDVSEVDEVLHILIEQGPYVAKLPREPGKRESRYAHLFGAKARADAPTQISGNRPDQDAIPSVLTPAATDPALTLDRLNALEQEIRELKCNLDAIYARFDQLFDARLEAHFATKLTTQACQD